MGFGLACFPDVVPLTESIMPSRAGAIIPTLTLSPPRPYCRFIATWFPQSRQPSKPFQSHSPHVNGLSVALGGIHMAIPRTFSEPSSLATWNRALRRPHRQRMRRDTQLRFKSNCLVVSGAYNNFVCQIYVCPEPSFLCGPRIKLKHLKFTLSIMCSS